MTSLTAAFGSSRAAAFLVEKSKLLPAFALEAIIFSVFFQLYFIGRGLAPTRPDVATDNALTIIDMEKWLYIFVELDWQGWALDNPFLIDIANNTYRFAHLPLIATIGIIIFFLDMRKFRVLRNAMLITCILGVPFYHLTPVTPPRLLDENGVFLGFVDTLEGLRQAKPGPLKNEYAAIPSYHAGWILLMVFGIWWTWRIWALRLVAAAFLALMIWAIVVTANHYFLDMVMGAAFVVFGIFTALAWERWAEWHPERIRWFTFRVNGHRLPF